MLGQASLPVPPGMKAVAEVSALIQIACRLDSQRLRCLLIDAFEPAEYFGQESNVLSIGGRSRTPQ